MQSNWQAIIDAQLEVQEMNPDKHVCDTDNSVMFCFAMLANTNESAVCRILHGHFAIQ